MEFPENRGGQKGLYMDDLFTSAALNFLRINKPDPLNNYRPFFLYLAYTIPHANNEEGQRTGNGMEVPSDAPYSDQPWPQTEKNKAAMITRLDAYVGRLLDKLKELKIDDNTIVFFSSDNGPHKEGGVDPKFFQSAGPLRGIKRDLYEGGIRVPLIVRWPGKIKPGTVSDRVSAFWDFLPTAAEIAQAKAPEQLDGLSLLPALLGKPQTNQHDFLYWEFHERGFQQAVRMGDWKAVRLTSRRAARALQSEDRPGRERECGGEESRGRGEDRSLSEEPRGPNRNTGRLSPPSRRRRKRNKSSSGRGSPARRARSSHGCAGSARFPCSSRATASAIASKTAASTNHGQV